MTTDSIARASSLAQPLAATIPQMTPFPGTARLAPPAARSIRPVFCLGDRARVIVFLTLAVATALLQTLPAAAGVFAAALLLTLSVSIREGRLPKGLVSTLAAVNVFVGMLFAIVPWTTPGTALWTLGPVAVTQEGIDLCVMTALRCNAVVLFFVVLAMPLGVARVTGALASLGMPAKLTTLIVLMARQIHVLRAQYVTMREAARLRGFEAGLNRHSYRTLAAFVTVVFMRAFARNARLTEALMLKSFTGVWPVRKSAAPGAADIALCAFVALVSAAVLAWDMGWLA